MFFFNKNLFKLQKTSFPFILEVVIAIVEMLCANLCVTSPSAEMVRLYVNVQFQVKPLSKIFMFYELMFGKQFSKSRNKTGLGTLCIIVPD